MLPRSLFPASPPEAEYRWSSAAAHVAGFDDRLVRVAPVLELDPKWVTHVACGVPAETIGILRRHEATGRPLGSEGFLTRMEAALGRILRPRRRGPKKKLMPTAN